MLVLLLLGMVALVLVAGWVMLDSVALALVLALLVLAGGAALGSSMTG